MKVWMQRPNDFVITLLVITIFFFATSLGSNAAQAQTAPTPTATAATPIPEAGKTEQKTAEPKSAESKSVNPQLQSEVEKKAAEKRHKLMQDAVSAVEETQKALAALDAGKKDEALAALERVSGKLDLIVAREPALALAPVSVITIIRDLYSNPDTVKATVKEAKDYLANGKIQQARLILNGVASEAEVQVTNIPLASYPAAIKAIAPLIDAGKIDEAKIALRTALNTLVIQSFVMPYPKIRPKQCWARQKS